MHIITRFPKRSSAKAQSLSVTEVSTSDEVTTSRRGRYLGGLKKWVIRKREAISEDMFSTSSARGSVEVFEETMVLGPMCSDMLW